MHYLSSHSFNSDEEEGGLVFKGVTERGKIILGQKLLALVDDDFAFEALVWMKLLIDKDQWPGMSQVIKAMLVQRGKIDLLKKRAQDPLVWRSALKLRLKPQDEILVLFSVHVVSEGFNLEPSSFHQKLD